MSISQSPQGFWTIEGDSHIGKWCLESGRLDHDQNTLPILYRYIRPGDFVMDIGALYGDHTVAYADWTGPTGRVLACECNLEAVECLKRNTSKYKNIEIFPHAIYSKETTLYFEKSDNVGASFVSEINNGPLVKAYAIDKLYLEQLDYLKIDAEGSEVEIIVGGTKTIMRHQPVIVMEVNPGALKRAGSSEESLLGLLRILEYEWKMLFEGNEKGDQYDIIARYKGFKNL